MIFGRRDRSPVNPVPLVREAAGSPAVNLAKIREGGHLNLVKSATLAGDALARRKLSGIRAQAVAVVDHSGSMAGDYRSGAVQKLVERTLGFALQIDVDGTVPLIAFDHRVWPQIEVTADNYEGIVERSVWHPQRMGTTDLAAALDVVRGLAAKTKEPLFVAIVTDGDPDDARAATDIVCDLARYPVFLKFLALRRVPYLSTLDTLDGSKRLLDNCNAQPGGNPSLNLLTCSDMDFQEAMAEEWDAWVAAAQQAGVLT